MEFDSALFTRQISARRSIGPNRALFTRLEPCGLELRAIHVFIRDYFRLSEKIDVEVNAGSAPRALWICVEA